MTFCKVGVKYVPETNNQYNLQIYSRTFQRKNTGKTSDLLSLDTFHRMYTNRFEHIQFSPNGNWYILYYLISCIESY